MNLTYHYAADRPATELWIYDRAGNLIDFSSGYTFSFKVGGTYASPTLNKTSGITGGAGSGSEPTGTPNVTITWTAAELATALGSTRGRYTCWLTCTTSSLDRVYTGIFNVTA